MIAAKKKKNGVWGAAKMMEFAEEQKVTNILIKDLHKEMLKNFQELRVELQDLRTRFDVHRSEAFRRITALEEREKP